MVFRTAQCYKRYYLPSPNFIRGTQEKEKEKIGNFQCG